MSFLATLVASPEVEPSAAPALVLVGIPTFLAVFVPAPVAPVGHGVIGLALALAFLCSLGGRWGGSYFESRLGGNGVIR